MVKYDSGAILVAIFFMVYAFLWWVTRRRCQSKFGVDPHVMACASDPIQRFMFSVTRLLTGGIVVVFTSHLLFIDQHPWLEQLTFISTQTGMIGGALLGFGGLLLCGVSQWNMGASWRVGIDESRASELVTSGIHGLVRNPTYTGLFLVILGMWLIWPTAVVAMYGSVYVLFFEIQVRCEECSLISKHGKEYIEYSKRTKRYIPWIY